MKKVFFVLGTLVILAVLAVAAAAFVYNSLRQPVNASDTSKKSFVVPPGQAGTTIATRLQEAGFIRHPLVFRLEAKRLGLESKLQSGSFELSPSMTTAEVAQALTTGTNDIWITLPEGWRREEIAEYLAGQELPAFDEKAFLDQTATLEGQLYPDTYLVPRQITTTAVINLLRRTFEQKFEAELSEEFEESGKSLKQVLTMASLVEREARTYEQMREVSGILWKRIEIGMPLQVDATLQYARGYDKSGNTWWAVPTDVDRKRSNPYNTYENLGLPPGPIANPGINALKATLRPLESDNLFYIHDNEGNIHTAETLDQHNANIQRYLR